MGDPALVFRLIAASAIIGLLVYSGSHVFQVWRKRNARKPGSSSDSNSVRKIACVCLIVGLILIPAAVVLREFTRSEGVLTGEELFVVRARDDLAVEWMHPNETSAADEALVRFGSRPSTAKIDELRARLARAEAERDVLKLSPLTPDPDLTRRHQVVAQERAQIEQELGHTTTASESASRDLTAQLQSKKETLARLARSLTERRKDLDRAAIRAAHYQDLAKMYSALLARGTITAAEYRENQKSQREAETEVASLTQELKDGQSEKALLQQHVVKLEATKIDPKSALPVQVETMQGRLLALRQQEEKLKAALELDAARTVKLRDAELSQAAAKIRECEAGIQAMSGGHEARAPFSGRVAYRAPSPNAVRPGGALLVVGPENGFLLTARMPRSEAAYLQAGSVVTLEVAGDTPERKVPARFVRTQDLVHEPGQASIQMECQPPPEVVRRLAEGEKLTVAFSWSPPLVDLWPFQGGIALVLVGGLGLILPRVKRPAANSSALALWRMLVPSAASQHAREILNRVPAKSTTIASLTDLVLRPRNRNERVETADTQGLADELEELCRQVVERVNVAETPEQATWLLDQLHRIRSTHRVFVQEIGDLHDDDHRIVARADS